MEIQQSIDVICQFSSNGTIIPLKLRFPDEDGEMNEYKVLSYRQHKSTLNHITSFDCKINSYNKATIVTIYFSSYEKKWYKNKM